jgi:hypothetical protein
MAANIGETAYSRTRFRKPKGVHSKIMTSMQLDEMTQFITPPSPGDASTLTQPRLVDLGHPPSDDLADQSPPSLGEDEWLDSHPPRPRPRPRAIYLARLSQRMKRSSTTGTHLVRCLQRSESNSESPMSDCERDHALTTTHTLLTMKPKLFTTYNFIWPCTLIRALFSITILHTRTL